MKRKIEERCRECGSTDITHDAIAEWDSEKQAYVLIDIQEGCYCNSDACQGDTCRVAEFDVQTGEALGRPPGIFDYIPKAQADAAWADYHKERKTEREARDRARQQKDIIADNAAALVAAHQEIGA